MSLLARARRLPPATWAAVAAVLLILPGLGSFGFWDPWELNVADRARDVSRGASLFDATAGGRYTAEPPLDAFLSGLGMKVFGAREWGGRIFLALSGILAVMAVFWGGRGLFRARAGLLGALALVTMPIFLLQTRQLTSDVPLVAGLALAMAGLGRFAWPASGRRSMRDLLVAAAGMLLGTLSGGALLGLALPALALTATIIAGWGLSPRAAESDGAAALTSEGVGRDVPAGKSFGAGLLAKGTRGRALLVLVAVAGVVVLILTLTTANIAGKYSLLLGGVPRGGTPGHKFEYLVRQLGFGLFPWSALVVFALGRPLVRLGGSDENDGGRLAFAQLYLLVFAAFGFALTTIFVLMTGEARFPALAPLALAVGSLLDEALEGERAEPVLGLLVATGTMVVARDFFLAPEEVVSAHLLNKVKWPPTLQIGPLFLATGVLVALGIYTGLATRGRALGRVALRDIGNARPWRRWLERIVVETGRWGIQVAVAAALVFAAVLSHVLVPYLSRHFSFKPVLESYTRYAKEGEEIGKYRVVGHGSGFYSSREMIDLPSQDRVVEFLRSPRRSFVLVASEELAALHSALTVTGLPYAVIDASSSRFLLLSNRLGPGEQDENPLKKDVWMAPRPPTVAQTPGSTEVRVDWHGATPPWQWRVPASATYGNAIELVGADYPKSMRRPGKIPLTLYFRVNQRPPGSYKVFVHFDAPGEPRLIGDHAPVGNTFSTQYWLPGEYIRDRYDVDVPLMTTPAGVYTILVGFWPGGEGRRLPITAGANDGADRARIGTIEIR